MSDGEIIQIVPKMLLDARALVPALSYEQIIVPAINVVPYSQVIVMLRLHSKSADTGAGVELVLREVNPSDEDGADFVITTTTFLTVSVTSNTAAPSLTKSTVTANPGPFLRVILRQRGADSGNTKGTFEISADMVVRSGI